MITTSKDVARLARVSRSTVSRALSGSVRVSDEVRARVLAAVEATEYEPDIIAQSLAKQHAYTISLALSNKGDGIELSSLRESNLYFYLDILARIEKEVVAQGYDLLLSSPIQEQSGDYIRSLKRRRVAGVLMVSSSHADKRVQKLLKAEIPTVFIDIMAQGKRATYVKADNIGGMRLAVEHLLSLVGHLPSSSGMLTRSPPTCNALPVPRPGVPLGSE